MNSSEARCDLHLHSYYSDGSFSPEELVRRSHEAGLAAIAVTDHDTLAGQDEVSATCQRYGIEFVSGLELSAREGGVSLHLIGYCIETRDEALEKNTQVLRDARISRARLIVEKLGKLGIDIPFKEVCAEAGRGALGRPHIAKILYRRGIVASIQGAFNRYIGGGAPCYVPKKVIPLERIFSLITSAGGVVVWAHPGQYINDEGLLDTLCGLGLTGIEMVHPNHSPAIEGRIAEVALRRGLVCTGGSDFHYPEAMQAEIGEVSVPYDTVLSLRRAAAKHNSA
ncbi:MAG: PHP domain-containing protein [bacterium]|nr:MAG: PHP domain-containing protein [bacterium]